MRRNTTATPTCSFPPPLAGLALLLPLLLAHLSSSTLALQIPFQQQQQQHHHHHHQSWPPSTPLSQHRRPDRHPHSMQVQDDDPAIVPSIRLSHQGLYINQPHSAVCHPQPSDAPSSEPLPSLYKEPEQSTSPFPLTLYFDTDVYRPQSAVARISPAQVRSRDDVMLECGSEAGGIESCEDDDLAAAAAAAAAAAPNSTASSQQHSAGLECRFDRDGAVRPDGSVRLDHTNCPGWQRYWSRVEAQASGQEVLTSFVVSLSVDTNDGSGSSGSERKPAAASERWWIGQLRLRESRASWPLAGNARARRPGRDDWTWHPDDVNRISGSMESPLIPKTSKVEAADPLQGVYVEQSSWNLGVQIRVPFSITTGANATRGSAQAHPSLSPSANETLLPPERVFAPVAGQVVWSRPYLRRRPPLVGAGQGWNDEATHCLMIRDEWSIVYQIFGIAADTIVLKEGDEVARGDVLGQAMREGLTSIPPSTDPPTDHPDSKDDKSVRFYPYRYRRLEVRVARPHRRWTDWKGPDELGWQYFQPLHVFREGRRYRSGVPPYGSPTTLYFGRPSTDPLNVPPVAFASSEDFFTPTLAGLVEIYAGFEAFQQTPGDPADGMEPLALYALDLAVRKKKAGDRPLRREDPCDLGGDEEVAGRWRTMWEHSKIPNAWTAPFDAALSPAASVRWHSKLFAHYLAAFSYGTFFPTRWTSQFDEKAKRLVYVVGRQVRGEPKVRGTLRAEELMDEGRGRYRLVVRGRDYWGNVGCVASDVNLV